MWMNPRKYLIASAMSLGVVFSYTSDAMTCSEAGVSVNNKLKGPDRVIVNEVNRFEVEGDYGWIETTHDYHYFAFWGSNGSSDNDSFDLHSFKAIASGYIYFTQRGRQNIQAGSTQPGSMPQDFSAPHYCKDVLVQIEPRVVVSNYGNETNSLPERRSGTIEVALVIDPLSPFSSENKHAQVKIEKSVLSTWDSNSCSEVKNPQWQTVSDWSSKTKVNYSVDRCSTAYRATVFDGLAYAENSLKIKPVEPDSIYDFVEGKVHYHDAGSEFGLRLSPTLWDSSGPITRRYGKIHIKFPNGNAGLVYINGNIINDKLYMFDPSMTGTYEYSLEVCHEYLNNSQNNQCRKTSKSSVIVR